MKTIRSYSVPAFSVMLLLSCAAAQSMDRSFIDIDSAVGSPINASVIPSFKGKLQGATKFVADKAADVWAHIPDRGQASVMAQNAANEAWFQMTAPGGFVNNNRGTVAAAAIATPAVIVGGIMAKNAIQKAQAKKALVAAIDLDLLENVEKTTNMVGSKVQESLRDRKVLLGAKIPGSLNFEEILDPLFAIIPQAMPALCEAWKDFVAMSVAYDRASNYETVGLFTTALNKVLDEVEALYALHAEQNAPSTLTVAKDAVVNTGVVAKGAVVNAGVIAKNAVVNTAVSAKNAVVARPKTSVAVTAAAVAAPVVAKAGLVGKAVAFYNNIGRNQVAQNAMNKASNAATTVGKTLNQAYSVAQPAVANVVSRGLKIAKNNKGKLGAGAVVATGLYGMHRYLNSDEEFSMIPKHAKRVVVAPAQPQAETEQVEPVDSNLQQVGF